MPEPTVEVMIENVRTAINNALVSGGAIEWELNGRPVKHDYTQLLEIEKRLMARQSSVQPAGYGRALAEFVSRPE